MFFILVHINLFLAASLGFAIQPDAAPCVKAIEDVSESPTPTGLTVPQRIIRQRQMQILFRRHRPAAPQLQPPPPAPISMKQDLAQAFGQKNREKTLDILDPLHKLKTRYLDNGRLTYTVEFPEGIYTIDPMVFDIFLIAVESYFQRHGSKTTYDQPEFESRLRELFEATISAAKSRTEMTISIKGLNEFLVPARLARHQNQNLFEACLMLQKLLYRNDVGFTGYANPFKWAELFFGRKNLESLYDSFLIQFNAVQVDPNVKTYGIDSDAGVVEHKVDAIYVAMILNQLYTYLKIPQHLSAAPNSEREKALKEKVMAIYKERKNGKRELHIPLLYFLIQYQISKIGGAELSSLIQYIHTAPDREQMDKYHPFIQKLLKANYSGDAVSDILRSVLSHFDRGFIWTFDD